MKSFRMLVVSLIFILSTISPVIAESPSSESANKINIDLLAKDGEISIVDDTVQIHKTSLINTAKTRSGTNINYYESTTVALMSLSDSLTTNDIYKAVTRGTEGHYVEEPDKSLIARGYSQIYYSTQTIKNVTYYSLIRITGGIDGPGSSDSPYLESGIKYTGTRIVFGQCGYTAYNGYKSFSGEDHFNPVPRQWTCTYDKFNTWIAVSSASSATLNCQSYIGFSGRNSSWELYIMNAAFK